MVKHKQNPTEEGRSLANFFYSFHIYHTEDSEVQVLDSSPLTSSVGQGEETVVCIFSS